MKCTLRDENGKTTAFCYQVGDGDFDNDSWMPPELQDTSIKRSAYFFTVNDKGTDIKAETAAALAVNTYNFKNYDKEFSDKCLSYAQSLYEFAVSSPLGTTPSDGYYTSSSYYDDLTWSALWLYINTGEKKYLDDAANYMKNYSSNQNHFDWNNIWIAARCLYAEITKDAENWNKIKTTLDNCMTKYNTPEGYAFFSYWDSARHNCNAQMTALIYDKYNSCLVYSEWAKGQMEYLMGKNSLNRCYITGFNENSVKFPHHHQVWLLMSMKIRTGIHWSVLLSEGLMGMIIITTVQVIMSRMKWQLTIMRDLWEHLPDFMSFTEKGRRLTVISLLKKKLWRTNTIRL